MSFVLFVHTVRHLKWTQLFHQLLHRVHKAKYIQFEAPTHKLIELKTSPVYRYKGLEGENFTFINLTHRFSDWNFHKNGSLYTYNLNYFDFINADGFSDVEACRWIDNWIQDRPKIDLGLDPYPISLRAINWIKFFCQHPNCITKEREDSLWSQLKLLERSLEYHLLGNHLLENFFSLFIGAIYFQDKELFNKSSKLLVGQLSEQILSDGAHFEQSPMYHCILLDRLLDCINIGYRSENSIIQELKLFAVKQLGWLKNICYQDETFPLFNDASIGISPTPKQIFDYASRLGLDIYATPLGESGYRKMSNGHIEAIVDVGNITASYQPGHSHADTFSYELRIDGSPVIIDTGVSTYDKTERRQYERSSKAHNCVVINGNDSSEVWGGFRIGNRCSTTILREESCLIEACHDGYKKKCYRRFVINDESFIVEDAYNGEAISYIHLAPGIDIERIRIEGAKSVEVIDEKISVEYNRFIDIKVIKINFCNHLKYVVK